jgi:hypothetical protein
MYKISLSNPNNNIIQSQTCWENLVSFSSSIYYKKEKVCVFLKINTKQYAKWTIKIYNTYNFICHHRTIILSSLIILLSSVKNRFSIFCNEFVYKLMIKSEYFDGRNEMVYFIVRACKIGSEESDFL